MLDTNFERLADEVLAAAFDFYPTWAARLGLHAYDGRLGPASPEALDSRLRAVRQHHAALRQFPAEALSARQLVDREVLLAALEREQFELQELRSYQRNPLTYADALDVTLYVKRGYAPVDQRVAALAEHLRQLPGLLEQARRNLEPICPRVYVATALEMFTGGVEFLRDQLPAAIPSASAPALSQLQAAHSPAVAAVEAFVRFLDDELLPRASEDFALGPDRYRRMLWAGERLDVDLGTLRSWAEEEIARLREQLRAAARRLDPHVGPEEVVRRLCREHPTEAELVPTVERILHELRQFLREHPVVTVPEPSDCRVEPTPPFLRWAFAMMDTAGPFEERDVESFYYVTLPEPAWSAEEKEAWLSRFDVHTLRNTSVHEAYPGHHVHFLRVRHVPSRVGKALTSYAFVEGWAHYCEEMMLDCGYGDGDPRLRVAQLVDALVRAVRFRASLGLHTEAWTVEEAASRFRKDAYLEPLPARKEAERGTFDPGYLSYTLGKMLLKELRADCERAWGPEFRLKDFHDRLLDLGAPPVTLARRAMLGDLRARLEAP
ncbi:MAG: DUF885 domain-containing protein [Armatimonadota bacterium]|nr:DUF885 domain-containing protein [Armatimonadota bacterium]MDW8155338.1 DUF885 domain-containing protein [Armatimonadota bacterium]